ncbi:Hypothetical predicted protein [Cloeon dipterum]|uniref:t-SNARE coiled-coil homology domain-containing protein n=1 Tax=Cloeon dipterum TaxID=197152 RepID=A0A8S1CM78_9INSE|nr:Hypothetical predicted protein [Cloeon dipterum]
MEVAEEEAPRGPATYEHACMRAELLGLPRPTREEYEASKTAIWSANYDDDELEELQQRRQLEAAADKGHEEAELVEELESQKEEMKGASGGLDELVNILAITQGKLNKFKNVCGSIKNLFKLRGDGQEGQSDGEATDGEASAAEPHGQAASATNSPAVATKSSAQGISSQLTSQNDILDRMLSKAENAEISLNSQNKQIKSLLR